jgi:hypothetical protein
MLKVIAKLKDIPDNATVTKRGGKVKYTVKRQLMVYREEGGQPVEVYAAEDCMFLVSAGGSINAFGLDKEVIWYTSLEELNAQAEAKERWERKL